MRFIDEVIDRAEQLTENGLTQGEVADELNVSRETAGWLVGQRDGVTADTESTTTSPTDVHIDWSATGREGRHLSHAGAIMADLLASEGEADVTVGVGKTGAPLATVVSQERETGLTVYVPSTGETTTRARTGRARSHRTSRRSRTGTATWSTTTSTPGRR